MTFQQTETRRKEEGKYMYAVIPSADQNSFGHIGINDCEVYSIPYRDISSVVSDTPVRECELVEDNLRRHDTVLRSLLDTYTVVPVEFGTVFQNRRVLEQLLAKAYPFIKESLRIVDNTVELGLKIVLKEDVTNSDGQLGKVSFNEILSSLKRHAVSSVPSELFSKRLVLNESFLIKKGSVDAFSCEVTRLESVYPTLKFLYSGPWAPYNFVYIKIGKSGIEVRKRGEK